MSLTNPNKLITEERLSDFYQQILPYMGGMPEVVNNKFSKGNLYSTDEKMIGQWIDGKPIYQKSYNATILGSQSSLVVDSIPTNLDKLIAITGSVVDVTNSIKTTLPFMNNTNYFCRVQMLNGDIKVLSAGNGDSFEVNFTIQYTKTTDSSISIGSDTDYSTDEKIIGTWIDSKPIYQKVFTDLSIAVTSGSYNKTIDVSAYNMDFLLPQVFAYDSNYGSWRLAYWDLKYYPGYLTCWPMHSSNLSTIIVQYTKSTD